ncbi:MAG: MaoC family dehydratase [Inquilinus sp.]|nr:MaoC family dehydratase [Inquilinus sp.]
MQETEIVDDFRRYDDRIEGYYLEDLAVGMSASFAKTLTDADIILFSGVSGDTNPVHLNEEYARETLFKGRISHGMLSAGFISAVLGTKLPGPGAIYISQSLRFTAPVRAGDTVTARCTVTEIVPEKRRAVLKTECLVGGKVVIDGEATVMVPTREKA